MSDVNDLAVRLRKLNDMLERDTLGKRIQLIDEASDVLAAAADTGFARTYRLGYDDALIDHLRAEQEGDRLRPAKAQAWDAGWEAHRLQEVKQLHDATHAIYRENPYRGEA